MNADRVVETPVGLTSHRIAVLVIPKGGVDKKRDEGYN